MPVIIDRVDLVDTEPRERQSDAAPPTPAVDNTQLFNTLRIAARRTARVHAD